MKKTASNPSFSKSVRLLIFSISMTLFATTSVFADPIKETVIAKGSLSRIVSKNYPNSQLSKAQIMIAILAKNPSVFRGANINFMLGNKTLLLPSEAVIASIPIEHAKSLLAQHNHFYQQGKTGNLTPPTFINSGGDPAALEKLKNQHSKQTVRVEQLSEESTRLQSLVQHLESEKDKRDEDLRVLEEKIQILKASEREETTTPVGKDSPSTQRLKDKNAALQQQLVESKSELAENNRTTISLERRVIELQDQQVNKTTDTADTDSPSQPNPTTASTSTEEILDAPATDLNGNIISPEDNPSTGFDLSKLIWGLPLLALLVGLGFLLKRFFSAKQHSKLNLDEVDDFDFTTPKMKVENRTINEINPTEEASLEVSIKLDVARAYMEADDNQSAYEMLNEVLKEGTTAQQQEAKQLLAKL
jgi:FimV-like protein